jgi:hypothetical protein
MGIGEKGDRVKLILTTNPFLKIKPGVKGTILMVGSDGTVFVEWDNGTIWGMIRGEDEWEPLKAEKEVQDSS